MAAGSFAVRGREHPLVVIRGRRVMPGDEAHASLGETEASREFGTALRVREVGAERAASKPARERRDERGSHAVPEPRLARFPDVVEQAGLAQLAVGSAGPEAGERRERVAAVGPRQRVDQRAIRLRHFPRDTLVRRRRDVAVRLQKTPDHAPTKSRNTVTTVWPRRRWNGW